MVLGDTLVDGKEEQARGGRQHTRYPTAWLRYGSLRGWCLKLPRGCLRTPPARVLLPEGLIPYSMAQRRQPEGLVPYAPDKVASGTGSVQPRYGCLRDCFGPPHERVPRGCSHTLNSRSLRSCFRTCRGASAGPSAHATKGSHTLRRGSLLDTVWIVQAFCKSAKNVTGAVHSRG